MEDQGHQGEESIFPRAAIVLSPKAEAFRRLANARVAKLDTPLRILGNLANLSNYDFQAGDVELLFGAVEAKLAEVRGLFEKALSRRRRG